MRIVAGILMIIGAVFLAIIGLSGLVISGESIGWEFIGKGFFRMLPSLLVLLVAFILGFGAYRVLKGRK